MSYHARESAGLNKDNRQWVRDIVAGYLWQHRQPQMRILTLPCQHWYFEHLYLKDLDEHAKFIGVERSISTYFDAITNMPGKNITEGIAKPYDFSKPIDYAKSSNSTLFWNTLDDMAHAYNYAIIGAHNPALAHALPKREPFQPCNAAWLDLCSQLSFKMRKSLRALTYCMDYTLTAPLAITIMAAREPKEYSIQNGRFGEKYHVDADLHRTQILRQEVNMQLPHGFTWDVNYYKPFRSDRSPMLLALGTVKAKQQDDSATKVQYLSSEDIHRLRTIGRGTQV